MNRGEARLLLHVCCGPCAIHPVKVLSLTYGSAAYFYNPNVQPADEYARRLSAAKQYCESAGLRFVCGPYTPEEYSSAIAADKRKPRRCEHCYALRLNAAAKAAGKLGFDSFTTTLLASPYQDRDAILAAGVAAAQAAGVEFVREDFRDGYRDAQRESRELNMYRQKYCGCPCSKQEAAEERRSPKKRRA